MRINIMAKLVLYLASMMAAVMLSSQAPQSPLVDQDVAAPEEYPDSAGRGGDEWWRNYEVVEDRANELGDHLEMLYMYSVNPLELTTTRSVRRRTTTTPPPQEAVSPVSRPQPVVHRRPTTPAPPPPTEPPFSRPSSDFLEQSPEPPRTQAPFQGQARHSFQQRHPTTPAPPPPTELPFSRPSSDFLEQFPDIPQEAHQSPRTQAPFHGQARHSFQQRHPTTPAPPPLTELPFSRPSSDFGPQETQPLVPFQGHAPRQSFRLRHPSTLPAPQPQPTFSTLNNPSESESQLLPRRHPSTLASPEATFTNAPLQEETFQESAIEQRSQPSNVHQPVDVQAAPLQETFAPFAHPEAPRQPVFFVPSLPNIPRSRAAAPVEETPSSDPALATFSSDRHFTQVPFASQQDEIQTQPETHQPLAPAPSTAAFASHSPATAPEASGTTGSPFLAPAAIPAGQQRYSRLLNRYSLLDQVDAGQADVGQPPQPQTEILENNRLVRQPSPVGHAPFAPSSRNFLNHSSEEPTTTRRPRRRRLKTTTPAPAAVTDTQLSDSEEVLFSQPQPSRRFKPTKGRSAPSTASDATIEASTSPSTAGFKAEPLSIQSPAERPITSGSKRRSKRPQQEATSDGHSTAETLPVSPLVSSTREVVPTGRERSRTRPQPFQTASTERVSDVVTSGATEGPESSSSSTPFRSGRIQKTRPSFSPRATSLAPALPSSSESQDLALTSELTTERSSGRRTRFGATQSSRRLASSTATASEPVETSTLPAPATQQQGSRSRRLNPRTSSQRFTTTPSVITNPPVETTPALETPGVDTGSSSSSPFQSQSASKFKPRGSSFRRTTTTYPTTTAPSTTTPYSTTAAATSATEATSRPEVGTGSRFKPRPSKFRAFPSSPTGTTTTATTVASTEATAEPVSSTELLETTTTTGKFRKFQGRNSFPRFQDSAKRAPFTGTTTTEAATEAPTTTRTASSKFFKSRAPFSRFQPGTTKAPLADTTEITPSVAPTSSETAQPVFEQQPETSPRTSQRPLFKTRTSGQFPFRGTAAVSTTAAPPSLAPIAESSPVDVPSSIPVITVPVPQGTAEQDSPTPFNSKRRRRPVTKKSFSQPGSEVTSPTFTQPEPLPLLAHRQDEAVPTYIEAAQHAPIPVASEQHFPLEFQGAAPAALEEVPKRRKVRRRKLTKKRSTQSFSDERAAASEITKVIANLTSTATSAISENVTAVTAATTTTSTAAATTRATASTTTTSTAAAAATRATASTTASTTTTTTPTTTVGTVLKDIAKEKPLESKTGLSGQNAKKQLLLESLEEPLTALADESGDDSGIWFSDSAGIGSEPEGARGFAAGGLHKLFQVENSEGDDSKTWFGVADEGLPQSADSSPANDTEHHQSRSLSESKPEPEVPQDGPSAPGSNPEVVAEGLGEADNKTAKFSVSSSTSVHTEVSKSSSSQISPEEAVAKEEDLKLEDGPPPIIIIDKVNSGAEDNPEVQATTQSGDGGAEPTEKEFTTSTTPATTTTTEEAPSTEAAPKTERPSRGRTTTAKTSRDKSSRPSSRDAASRNRASAAKSAERGRSAASSRRDRTSTTTPATTTTEELTVTEDPEALVDITEAPKKKSSDEVNYFGEDEVVPSSHGALDGPADGGLESGPPEADGEVASVDVSEHNDPNDRGHGSETAPDDDASRWELSPLSDFNGPIRESSSFNVEVLSKAPKQLQLASRRETKSSRSDLGDEFSTKRESRNKMRNFLKIISMNAAAFAAAETASGGGNATETATKRVRVIPLKSFAFPVPPIKTPEDIAELFETITSAPSGPSRPFQPPSRAVILRLNSTSNDSAAPEVPASGGNATQTSVTSAFKTQALNGPANCSRSDRNICPLSEEYPRNLVELVVKQHQESVKRLWTELEAKRTPAELFPEDAERKGEALSVCDSSIEALQPGWARDATTGKWMIIINTPEYPQFLRVESCLRLKKECLFISPYYKSSCVEHYSAHRMVAIRPNDPASGPVVAIFKFPCGCSCKVGMLHGGN